MWCGVGGVGRGVLVTVVWCWWSGEGSFSNCGVVLEEWGGQFFEYMLGDILFKYGRVVGL